MPSDYIERRNDGFYVAGTRVSLDSVVYAFRRGDSPERILEREASAGPPLSETNPALSKRLDRARSQAGASQYPL